MAKNLFKRGAVWWVKAKVNGKQYRQTTGKIHLAEAKVARDAIISTFGKSALQENAVAELLGLGQGQSMPLLSEAGERVLSEHWTGLKDGRGSFDNVQRIAMWQDVPLDAIDREYISQLINHLKGRQAAPATINRYLAALRFLLRFAIREWDLPLTVPPFKMQREVNRRERVLTRDEALRITRWLWDNDKLHHADLVEVLLDTGMRLGEALGLEYGKSIDLKNGVIRLSAKTTKTSRPRIIPMTPRVKAILEARETNDNPRLAFNFQKWAAARAFKEALMGTGLPLNEGIVLYTLRHTAATWMLEGGASLYEVSKVLGHSNPNVTTDRYAHYEVGAAANAINALPERLV